VAPRSCSSSHNPAPRSPSPPPLHFLLLAPFQFGKAERELTPPHAVASPAGIKLRHRTTILRLCLPTTLPRSPPPRAPAIAFIHAVVRPKRRFPSIAGAMAAAWPCAARALPTAPSSPFSSTSHSPWHHEAAALPRLPS
jgi:hypothetical protein